MTEPPDLIAAERIDRLADESGLAIAIVDDSARDIFVSNNNSICQNLNPNGGYAGECAAFCGDAYDKASDVGAIVSYTCHAGLECRAVPIRNLQRPLVAIVGRSFTRAENYRTATERAISGDWSQYPPSKFFENVLLAGSDSSLDRTVERLESAVAVIDSDPGEHRAQKEAVESISTEPETEAVTTGPSERRTVEFRAWRSFFGSLLKTDHVKAADSILEFLAAHYGLSSLIWLERIDGDFVNTATFGEMKQRKVKLGISPDDKRLVEILHSELPLELGERSKEASGGGRTMKLFPIGVSDEISSAIAIFDPIDDEKITKQITRFCNSIAPQLEILRLRGVVARGERLSNAVRNFSESLRHVDADDLWISLTQNAAEMLRAERASLLIYDEKADALEIKAMIGAKNSPHEGEEIGGRVSKIVFSKNEGVAVSEVSKTGLPPAPPDRQYRTSSFLSCPISISGRNIGVMNFTDQAAGTAFDRGSLELFQAIEPQLAVTIDRASLKEKAGEFEQLSVTDPLTGLLNRRYIEERMLEEIKRSTRHGLPMSFMMLDVDHFKSYNDQFGHPAGDEALKRIGHVIRDTLRSADVAARFGGEEFSILLPQTAAAEAAAIAERIRSNIEHARFEHNYVTASIGVASCSAEVCETMDLVGDADKALYEAKRLGRNQVVVFEDMQGAG